MNNPTENEIHQQITEYLKVQYPDVIFRTDFGAGIKLTKGQAVKHSRLQSCRGYPDLFIAKPNIGKGGLYLELKRPGERLRKRNGEWASEHIAEQAAVIERLRSVGYHASFAVGFDEAKQIIDRYLSVDQSAGRKGE